MNLNPEVFPSPSSAIENIDKKKFSKDAIATISEMRKKYSQFLSEKYNVVGTSDTVNSFIHENFHSAPDSAREKWLDNADEAELTKIARTVSLLSGDFTQGPGIPSKGYYSKRETIPTLAQWLDAYENAVREIAA